MSSRSRFRSARRLAAIAAALMLLTTVTSPAWANEPANGEEPVVSEESKKRDIVAGWLGIDGAELSGLRDSGMGWGTIFKLKMIGDATGTSVGEVLAGAQTDGGTPDLSWGALRKNLSEQERARLAEGSPRNFGQLVSAKRRAANQERKAARDAERDAAKAERDAAKAARDAERDAAKAERDAAKAERDAAKAARKAERDAAKAERDAAKAARKAERDAAKAARPADPDDSGDSDSDGGDDSDDQDDSDDGDDPGHED